MGGFPDNLPDYYGTGGDNKPGTYWAAKHAAAGSKAQPANDRPYAVDWSQHRGDLGDGGVCHSPSNKADES